MNVFDDETSLRPIRDNIWKVNPSRTVAMSALRKNGSRSLGFASELLKPRYPNDDVLDIPIRVAWIRHPIERLISAYSFFKLINERDRDPHRAAAHTSNWHSFVDYTLITENEHFDSQVDQLTKDGIYIPTVTEKFENIMIHWGKYLGGSLPWVNGVVHQLVDDYRSDDLAVKYAKDMELWLGL